MQPAHPTSAKHDPQASREVEHQRGVFVDAHHVDIGWQQSEQVLEALQRARAASDSGVPAVLDCTVDTWDYPQGFTDFHRDVWGLELPA